MKTTVIIFIICVSVNSAFCQNYDELILSKRQNLIHLQEGTKLSLVTSYLKPYKGILNFIDSTHIALNRDTFDLQYVNKFITRGSSAPFGSVVAGGGGLLTFIGIGIVASVPSNPATFGESLSTIYGTVAGGSYIAIGLLVTVAGLLLTSGTPYNRDKSDWTIKYDGRLYPFHHAPPPVMPTEDLESPGDSVLTKYTTVGEDDS